MQRALIPLGLTACLAAPAPAQQPDALAAPPPRAWTVQFEPAGWYVAAGGKIGLPGAPAGTPRIFISDLNLDSPRWTPLGELHLRSDNWRVTLSGFAFSISDRGAIQGAPGHVGALAFGAGDRLTSTLDFASAEASVAYTFNDHLGGHENFTGTIDVLGGLRAYDVSIEVSAPSGSLDEERFFAHPFAGTKVSLDIMRDFTIDVQLDLGYFPQGGGGSTIGYQVMAGFQWRPTPNLGVQIGYRDLAWSLESGDGDDAFDYEGALQGLYAGAVLRF